MTAREQTICRCLLAAAHDAEGRQYGEAQLHAATNALLVQAVHVPATLTEFEAALAICDYRGWVIGVTSPVSGRRKWCISDLGEAARTEL
jgi:hypothetical protein